MRLPRTSPPQAETILRPMARLRWSLTDTTVSTIRTGAPASWPILMRASVSLGKQEPP